MLTAETAILLDDFSQCPAGAVRIGDRVMTADESRQLQSQPVVGLRSASADCYHAEFSEQNRRKERKTYVVAASPETEILSLYDPGSREMSGRTPSFNAFVAGPRSAQFRGVLHGGLYDDASMPSDSRDLLLGMLLGDGYYAPSSQSGVYLSCYDPTLIDDTREYLHGLGLVARSTAARPELYRLVPFGRSEGRYYAFASNDPALAMLRDLGVERKLAHEKVIPEVGYSWSNASVARLLSGLLVTDGSIFSPCDRSHGAVFVSFASTSERMVHQIAELLKTRFGVHDCRFVSHSGERNNALHTLRVMSAYSVRRLLRTIPLFGVKKLRAAQLMRSWTTKKERLYGCLKRGPVVHRGSEECVSIQIPAESVVLGCGLIARVD